MDLSIIIPAYNEELRITQVIFEIFNYFKDSNLSYEIIIVDDGSTDDTVKSLSLLLTKNLPIKILRLNKNTGKGAAVKKGMLEAMGELRIYIDADGATPFSEISKLQNAITNDGYDISFGSRAIKDSDVEIKAHLHRKILGRIFNTIVNFFVLPEIKDSQCGFKMFTAKSAKEIFSKQKIDRFAFDVEILYIAKCLNMKMVEIPVNWHNVPGSKVNLISDSLGMALNVLSIPFRHSRLVLSKNNIDK